MQIKNSPKWHLGFTPLKAKKSLMGFTLIELILVLAISSLLAVILLNNYTSTRRRAQFTDAIERVVTQLEQAKNEANTTVNSESSGTNSSRLVFAKSVVFSTAAPSQFRIYTLSADNADALAGVSVEPGERSIDIPWGVSYQQSSGANISNANTITFSRAVSNGVLNTYAYTASGSAQIAAGDFSSGSTADQLQAQLLFTSPEGLQAFVRVNSISGTVIAEYL